MRDNFFGDQSNSYLAAIVDSSDDAIIGKRLDGTIISWNKSAERIFGYKVDEIIGKNISTLIPSNRQDEEFIIIGKIKNGERIEHFETVRRAKDGTLVDLALTVSPIKDTDGSIIGASQVARDIRVTKEAERVSAYLASIIGSSDDAIISKNLSGIITSWNESAEKLFGYSSEEAVGKHITLIIPEDMIDEEYAIIGKIKNGEKVDHFETKRRAKSGDLIEISITVSPIRDKKGNIIGASKIARSISEQKRTMGLLQDSLQKKEEFMANMSHELRTPLNAIIGLSHILEKSERMSSKEQQCVTMIRQSGDHLLSLINNILDFTKAESGALQLDTTEFNLPELVEKTFVLYDTEIRNKGLQTTLVYEGRLREYYLGDPLRIRQILTNLLSNAIKFTEKGIIALAVRMKEELAGASILEISVSDTGIGIAKEKINSIFDKFTQADASTARNYGGTGLGLSISRSLAEAMNGTISVESTLGLGSTFTVSLTLLHGERNEVLKQTGLQRHAYDVLIVEDYPPNIMVASRLLEELGYSYDKAENGLEALRKIEGGDFRAVLMDVQMPGMDGFECTRKIREFEKSNGMPRTPIVAVTAHVLEKNKADCLAAGMDDFMAKPFTPDMLEQTLDRIFKAD